jgi:hypothetical protein
MHQAHVAYPTIRGYGADTPKSIEPVSSWSTRSSSAKHASAQAKNEASGRGNMSAMGMFQAAEAESIAANQLVNANRDNFTLEIEQKVAKHLADARNAFNGAIGLARTAPPTYTPTVSFPTWTISASKLPPGAPGGTSPGVLPPPTVKTPPKGDQGGVDEGSLRAGEWYKNPTTLAIAGVGGAVVLLALVMAVRR